MQIPVVDTRKSVHVLEDLLELFSIGYLGTLLDISFAKDQLQIGKISAFFNCLISCLIVIDLDLMFAIPLNLMKSEIRLGK